MQYFARWESNPKILELSLDNKEDPSNRAKIDILTHNGESPLHKLMSRTNIPIDLLKALVARGADINAEDKMPERALSEAAIIGKYEAIEAILSSVTDIDDESNKGRTALHEAAWKGHIKVAELLLENNASANKKETQQISIFLCLPSPV